MTDEEILHRQVQLWKTEIARLQSQIAFATKDDIHPCSYHCDRPDCIREQRDELRDKHFTANRILWIGALHYYLGRMTYAVSEFCQLLIDQWPTFQEELKRLILGYVDAAFAEDDEDRYTGRENKRLGMDCDREEWERVRMLWQGETK